jgi:hypothetical protein
LILKILQQDTSKCCEYIYTGALTSPYSKHCKRKMRKAGKLLEKIREKDGFATSPKNAQQNKGEKLRNSETYSSSSTKLTKN